jgi:hypothetical protein
LRLVPIDAGGRLHDRRHRPREAAVKRPAHHHARRRPDLFRIMSRVAQEVGGHGAEVGHAPVGGEHDARIAGHLLGASGTGRIGARLANALRRSTDHQLQVEVAPDHLTHKPSEPEEVTSISRQVPRRRSWAAFDQDGGASAIVIAGPWITTPVVAMVAARLPSRGAAVVFGQELAPFARSSKRRASGLRYCSRTRRTLRVADRPTPALDAAQGRTAAALLIDEGGAAGALVRFHTRGTHDSESAPDRSF